MTRRNTSHTSHGAVGAVETSCASDATTPRCPVPVPRTELRNAVVRRIPLPAEQSRPHRVRTCDTVAVAIPSKASRSSAWLSRRLVPLRLA